MNDNEQFSELPVNLFHGNLNLIDLSIKYNKLYKLDAVQVPLDQLRKLSVAGNPFVCNCSLIWLWQLIKSSSLTTVDGEQQQSEMDANELMGNSNGSNLLVVDKENIVCNVKVIRKQLTAMSEADIKCP
jgi:leucine-rich repeat and immunoglobulin-like domain-containing nogo receptor-interacting protein